MVMYCTNCGNEMPDNSDYCVSCGNQVSAVANGGTYDHEHQSHKMDERRIFASYIVAIVAPIVLGGYAMGIGHFVVGRYKRGILILISSLVVMFAVGMFLVGWPMVGASYTLPWAEYRESGGVMRAEVETLLPGIFITMLCVFLIWILQIIDLIRVNRTFSSK